MSKHGILVHDDPDLTYACPECDRGGVVYRRRQTVNAKGDAACRCDECGAEFAEPTVRETVEKSGGDGYADDGLPSNMADGMRERILELRGDA